MWSEESEMGEEGRMEVRVNWTLLRRRGTERMWLVVVVAAVPFMTLKSI